MPRDDARHGAIFVCTSGVERRPHETILSLEQLSQPGGQLWTVRESLDHRLGEVVTRLADVLETLGKMRVREVPGELLYARVTVGNVHCNRRMVVPEVGSISGLT